VTMAAQSFYREPPRRDLPRWLIAAVAVLAVHAGLGYLWFSRQPPEPQGVSVDAVLLDLPPPEQAPAPAPTPPQEAQPEAAPPPPLHPAGGFVIDPSLIYALVHHESNFSPAAVSHSGARELMQIKPATARGVSGDGSLAGLHVDHLHDPAVNLAVGQHYLLQLSEDDSIDGDLIRLLAGYGQGLFGFKRWADSVNDQGDPLLFLEAIPNPATRTFIQDILAWSWHYAAVLKLPAASLDALASGHFPRLVRTGAQAMHGTAMACDVAGALW